MKLNTTLTAEFTRNGNSSGADVDAGTIIATQDSLQISQMAQTTKLTTCEALGAYLCNAKFFISLFIFMLSVFMGFVCVLYGFGQITQLQLTNYWCEKKDLQTIYKHSWENNLNQGTDEGCWKSKRFTVQLISN